MGDRSSRKMSTARKVMRMADILTEKGYRLGQQIGEGTYSKVRTVERTADGQTCAVKIVDKIRSRKDYLQTFMPRELAIILKLEHENIIKTYEVIKTKDFVFQIMQYAENGDLLQIIQNDGSFADEKAKQTFTDICKGTQYLHDKNIAHRDLKCENILILKNSRAVISDFGFARGFDLTDHHLMCKTFCGSTAYASPELLHGIPYNPKINDIWSLGIILYAIICGGMPFNDTNIKAMLEKQLSKDIQFPSRLKDKIDLKLQDLLFQILEPDISKRPTIEQILSSEWLDT